jgi:hypothetical protein
MRRTSALAILICLAITGGPATSNSDPTPTPAPGGHRFIGGNVFRPPTGGFATPPPPAETPTTLTFFGNPDLTGVSYAVSLKPANSFQATRVVTQNDITAAGLAGKISSVQIVCGTRPSRASLFDIDWGQFSSGTMIECRPGLTTSINLATQTLGRDLNDKIGAAALVAHVRSVDNAPHGVTSFSTLFSSVWKTQMQSLGSGATAKWTQIWLEDFQDIHVEQALQLDSTWCSARDATFEIRINLSALPFKPVFKVYAVSEWVATGFGDAWGCHDGMGHALSSGVNNASTQLESQLPQLVLNDPSSSTYYFAPEGNTDDYDLFYMVIAPSPSARAQ